MGCVCELNCQGRQRYRGGEETRAGGGHFLRGPPAGQEGTLQGVVSRGLGEGPWPRLIPFPHYSRPQSSTTREEEFLLHKHMQGQLCYTMSLLTVNEYLETSLHMKLFTSTFPSAKGGMEEVRV